MSVGLVKRGGGEGGGGGHPFDTPSELRHPIGAVLLCWKSPQTTFPDKLCANSAQFPLALQLLSFKTLARTEAGPGRPRVWLRIEGDRSTY